MPAACRGSAAAARARVEHAFARLMPAGFGRLASHILASGAKSASMTACRFEAALHFLDAFS